MTNQIQVTAAAPVTISAATRKALTAAKLPEIVAGKLAAFPAAAIIRPSDIRMDKATAAASMGAKATPVSFISGLLFNLTAFAHGQGKADTLAAALPPAAAFAVRHGCGLLALGKGVTAENLKAAALAALDATLALPLPSKKEETKKAAAPRTIEGEGRRIVEQAAAPAPAALDVWKKAAALHDAQWSEYGDTLAAGFKAAAKQTAAPRFVDLFSNVVKSNREQAAAMLAEMASMLGLDLVSHEQAAAMAAAMVQAAAPAKKARAPRKAA